MSDRKGIDLTLGRKNNNELVCFEIGPLPLRTRFPRRMIVIKEIRRERDSGVENSGLRRVLPEKSPAPHLRADGKPIETNDTLDYQIQ